MWSGLANEPGKSGKMRHNTRGQFDWNTENNRTAAHPATSHSQSESGTRGNECFHASRDNVFALFLDRFSPSHRITSARHDFRELTPANH
jgi:hypothetical protein